MGTKEDIIRQLAQLYRLRDEGKHVDAAIAELEAKLCELMGCEDDEPED
jgi:hypothetical protein